MNRSTIWRRLGIVAAVLIAGLLFFHYRGYGPMDGYGNYWPMFRGGHGGMMAYGGGWGMGIGMLLFWGVIVVAVIWLVAGLLPRTNQTCRPEGQPDDALEILKKRYARGEIDKAEFEAKRRDLKA